MEERNKARYTLRTSKELLDKFGYIAMKRGRSKNKELEQMIKSRISMFEEKYGEITEECIKSVKEED